MNASFYPCRPSLEPPTAIRVLFETEYFLAVEKPSGMLVHPTSLAPKSTPTLLKTLRDQCGFFVYPVHRLDCSASGILLVAKSSESARELAELFQKHEVQKEYWAIVRGHPPDRLIIERPLREEPGKEPKPSLSIVEKLAQATLPVPVDRYPEARYALVNVRTHTGRFHQVRRHLRGVNHPIIGDTTYGDSTHNHLWAQEFGLKRLLLFSHRLVFRWRDTVLDLRCPMPITLQPVIEKLGWNALIPLLFLLPSSASST